LGGRSHTSGDLDSDSNASRDFRSSFLVLAEDGGPRKYFARALKLTSFDFRFFPIRNDGSWTELTARCFEETSGFERGNFPRTIFRLRYVRNVTQATPSKGVKHDGNKIRWTLLPWDALEEVVRVLEYGTRKYSEGNWRHVTRAKTRYTNAALRHMVAWMNGEVHDSETGFHHLAHSVANLLFVLHFETKRSSKKKSPHGI
jgi:hypothetical protein